MHYTSSDRREKRQREADERKQERAKRSVDEQLRLLRERGVTSGREYDRLMAEKEGDK